MPRFADCPLGEDKFRLFKLKPGTSNIEIEVRTFKIYKAPKYEAISYVWGDKSDGTATITCNGEPLEIWMNLHSALCRLQREGLPSWFWNDAICIEQGGEEVAVTEKARQVAFMETIFKLAQPVRAWLGDASDEEERALQYLVDTCQRLAEERVRSDDVSGLPGPRDPIWVLWVQFIIRPWFSRLWIVQEALLSGGELLITMGKGLSTTWSNFWQMLERTGSVASSNEFDVEYSKLDARARVAIDRDFLFEWDVPLEASKFNLDDAVRNCVYRNVVNIRELIYLAQHNYSLQQVIKVYGNRKCTYNQDRPNAMRGVLPKGIKKGLKVYRTDADVAAVYREVTRLWLVNDPTLSLLQRVRPRLKFLPEGDKSGASRINNPSWVLDLQRVLTESMASDSFNNLDGFHAGLIKHRSWPGKQEWKLPESGLRSRMKGSKHVEFPTEEQLLVPGVQIGIVNAAVYIPTRRSLPDLYLPGATSQHIAEWEQWLNSTLDLVKGAVGDTEEAVDIHWRALVHNRANVYQSEVKTMYDIDDRFSRRHAYTRLLQILKSRNPRLLRDADDETRRYYTTMFLLQRDFSNVFSTSNGLVGKSYPVPQAGDVVAVFNGAATPFLLRPVPGQPTYEFMGEGYAHGVMQGEALLEQNKDKFQKRTFVLV